MLFVIHCYGILNILSDPVVGELKPSKMLAELMVIAELSDRLHIFIVVPTAFECFKKAVKNPEKPYPHPQALFTTVFPS